jgi:hypothetical protein
MLEDLDREVPVSPGPEGRRRRAWANQMDDVRDCQSNCLKMTTCLSEFNWPAGQNWPKKLTAQHGPAQIFSLYIYRNCQV